MNDDYGLTPPSGTFTWLRPNLAPGHLQVVSIAHGGLERRGYDETSFLKRLEVIAETGLTQVRAGGAGADCMGARRIACRVHGQLLGYAGRRASWCEVWPPPSSLLCFLCRSRHHAPPPSPPPPRRPTTCLSCTRPSGSARWTRCTRSSCTEQEEGQRQQQQEVAAEQEEVYRYVGKTTLSDLKVMFARG